MSLLFPNTSTMAIDITSASRNPIQQIQCNVFSGASGPLALTAGGGRRGLPFLPGTHEEVAMIGIHHNSTFYSFVPWEGTVTWEVTPWGSWKMTALKDTHEVTLEATAATPGCTLRAPTSDAGLAPFCKDTFAGTDCYALR